MLNNDTNNNKKSFFQKIADSMKMKDDTYTEDDFIETTPKTKSAQKEKVLKIREENDPFLHTYEEEEDGELPIDVYETDNEIIIQAFVAGVRPDELQISITRDNVSIKGKRTISNNIEEENYSFRELYWGTFSRYVTLPEEIEPEEAEAVEKHGLLIIKLPKIDKQKTANIRVKSI